MRTICPGGCRRQRSWCHPPRAAAPAGSAEPRFARFRAVASRVAVRSRPDGTGPAGRDSAFVLPLALSVSLLVLLGSLSVQTAAIRNRLSQVGREEQRRQEDALVSLAHSVVGEFNRSSPCLLTVPLASWSLIAGGCEIGRAHV